MRLFRPASAACLCMGLVISLSIFGTGVGMSFYVANLFSGRARRGVNGVTSEITKWITDKNITISGITQDILIPSQSIQVEMDGSQLVNPLLEVIAGLPPSLGVETPVVNNTLYTTVHTDEFTVPVKIEGISLSIAALVGEALLQDFIDGLEQAPETVEDISYYFLLAVGLIATAIITNAILDKILYGGMGLWLKGDIQANANQARQQRTP